MTAAIKRLVDRLLPDDFEREPYTVHRLERGADGHLHEVQTFQY